MKKYNFFCCNRNDIFISLCYTLDFMTNRRGFPKLYEVTNKGLSGEDQNKFSKIAASSGGRSQYLLWSTLKPYWLCLPDMCWIQTDN